MRMLVENLSLRCARRGTFVSELEDHIGTVRRSFRSENGIWRWLGPTTKVTSTLPGFWAVLRAQRQGLSQPSHTCGNRRAGGGAVSNWSP